MVNICQYAYRGFSPTLIELNLRRGYYTAEEIAEKFGAP